MANNHKGELNPNSRLNDAQIKEIRESYKNGMSATVIARLYNITRQYVHLLATHKQRRKATA